jgi:hypothetical protein
VAAVEELRLRWQLEAELARLKSPSGPTGHYEGQYGRVKALGPGVVPILLDIAMDRARPLPGESAAGPYASIHPGMARFDRQELRRMAAYGFGEIVDRKDRETIARLAELHDRYASLEGDDHRFEREELAPDLAFSLFDLGLKNRAEEYVRSLRRRAREDWGYERIEAMWDLGFACIRLGLHDEGQYWYGQVLDETEGKAIAAYNLACNFAMRARREAAHREEFRELALDFLERSIREFGYGDWKWMEEDGDLAFIREEPKYQELLRHLQEKYPERQKGKVAKDKGSFLGPR